MGGAEGTFERTTSKRSSAQKNVAAPSLSSVRPVDSAVPCGSIRELLPGVTIEPQKVIDPDAPTVMD